MRYMHTSAAAGEATYEDSEPNEEIKRRDCLGYLSWTIKIFLAGPINMFKLKKIRTDYGWVDRYVVLLFLHFG